MGRWKRRRSFDLYRRFTPKRRREKSPLNFYRYTQYVEQQQEQEENGQFSENTEDVSDNELAQDTDESPPSELDDVKDTLNSIEELEKNDVKHILHRLVVAFDTKPDSVKSLLVKHDFFRRSDVVCMVTDKMISGDGDSEEWLENLVVLVTSIAGQTNISSRYTKTILGPLSQTKCIRDPLIKDQIRDSIAALQVRERLENLQDDGYSQMNLSNEIQEELRCLVDFPILPTAQMVRLNQHLPILPRALKAPHRSPAHYLIEQYSLFLEDFIGPLRKGIKHYMEYVMSTDMKERFKDENIRIYRRIRLLDDKCVPGSGVGLEVQFDTNSFKKIRWDCCRFLQYGNLVCLTYDNCDVLVYALIANRDLRQLTEGKVLLKILDGDQQSINNLRLVQESRLVMIESKLFYMVYDHTLRSLKGMASRMLNNNENIPLAKHLVYLNQEVLEPIYTRREDFSVEKVDFRCLLTRKKQLMPTSYRSVPILDVEKWPTSEEMGLNEYQHEALKMCLTKRIGILQGPPGTGKTWMGIRIMKFLLHNKRVLEKGDSRPILLLSHTNHALDQFFERVLDSHVDNSLRPRFVGMHGHMTFVRVGGRCTNERVKEFTLKEHRKRARMWSDNREHIQKSTKYVKYIDTFCTFLQKGIVSLEFLQRRNVIHDQHIWSLRYNLRSHDHLCGDAVLVAWLCSHTGNNLNSFLRRVPRLQDLEELDDLYLQEHQSRVLDDDDDESEIIHAIFPSFVFAECTGSVQYNAHPFGLDLSTEMSNKLLSYVKTNLRNTDDVMPIQNVQRIRNLWNLNMGDRWKLYKFWIREVLIHFQRERDVLVSHFSRKNQNELDARFKQDLRILKSCQMVGMTTTGAASNMDLLKEVQPRIVVVEEAAQVHEQHILGCLTKDIQHLILIGDHQQLRPTMNNHELKCTHKTDVSLMERLVLNGFPFQCLTQQHRMRPEISCLLTPAIYPSLQDHASVLKYPIIKGMKHNIFFISHQNAENQTTHSTSYANDFEVEMIAELYKYLILQGYANSDITILSAYNDQVRKIRKRVSEISQQIQIPGNRFLERVHITAVDNFQGEENKIILLSLVRSNKNCKLGHLGDPQRICVLLSRAKEGFYAVGNFQMLYDRGNKLWMKVITKAKENGILGEAIPLNCVNHPEKITSVSNPQDFEKVKDGGCDEPCSTMLHCGHVCEMKCHVDDSVHEHLKCLKPCLKKLCDEGHLCPKKCYEQCGPCKEIVKKQYSTCKHYVNLPCHEDLENNPCKEIVKKQYSTCKHNINLRCHEDIEYNPCKATCTRERNCGHPCKQRCSLNCDSFPCRVKVKAIHPNCNHESIVQCCHKEKFLCNVKCQKILQCGHRCEGNCDSCSNGRLHIPCRNNCSRVLICGHTCDYSHLCQKMCPPCKKNCEGKALHTVVEETENPSSREYVPHKRRCRKTLECRHRCAGLREEKCPELCKRCDRTALREIFFGTEENDDALFIQLKDCRHIFEVESMDTYMQSESVANSVKGKKVTLKKCPKCDTPIRRSHRYKNIIRQTYREIEKVHRKLDEERNKLLFEENGDNQFSDSIAHIVNLESNACENQYVETVCLEYFLGVESRNEKLGIMSEQCTHQEITNSNLVITTWILNHASTIFTQTELEQFTDEVERYMLYADLILMKNQLEVLCPENICQTDRDLVESQITKLRCPDGDKFDREDLVIATSVLDDLKRKAPSCFVQCSEEPRRINVNGVACRKHGQWFKCENGHIYISGDDTTEDCPECRLLQSDPDHNLQVDPVHDLQADPNHDQQADPNHDVQADPDHDLQVDPDHDLQTDPNHDQQADRNHDLQFDPDHDVQADPDHDLQADPDYDLQDDGTLSNETLRSAEDCEENCLNNVLHGLC